MSPSRATENTRFAIQLNQLSRVNQFLSEVAAAIVARSDDFENVWSIANRVYERHYPGNVRVMSRPRLDQAQGTALSA